MTREELQSEWTAPAPEFTATQPEVSDWSERMRVPSVPIQEFPTKDWSAQPVTEDWSTVPTAQVTEWVETTLSSSSTKAKFDGKQMVSYQKKLTIKIKQKHKITWWKKS